MVVFRKDVFNVGALGTPAASHGYSFLVDQVKSELPCARCLGSRHNDSEPTMGWDLKELPVPDGGPGRREPTCSQLPSDPGVLFCGEVPCGDSRASGTGSSRSSTCSTLSSQSGWSRSSRRNRPGPMFREWTLLPTLSQMDTTTFLFSLVYTSAVDSVSQLPRYCLWVRGIPNWKAQSGMKTRNECHVSASTKVLVTLGGPKHL